MNTLIITLILALSFAGKVNADDYFSHAIINIPYEYITDEPWMLVVNSRDEFEAFYLETIDEYYNSGFEIEPMPEIDFEKYTLVLGGIGMQYTGAVTLSIGKIIYTDNAIYINAVRVVPEGCLVTADSPSPTTGILLQKTDKKIIAYLDQAVSRCEY